MYNDDKLTNECTDEECAVHNRTDQVILNNATEAGSMVTYVDGFCVLTGDNLDVDPRDLIKMLLGGPLVDRYETVVFRVDNGKCLNDMFDNGFISPVSVKKHDDWAQFTTIHDSTVIGVTSGLLNASE